VGWWDSRGLETSAARVMLHLIIETTCSIIGCRNRCVYDDVSLCVRISMCVGETSGP